jgi:DNA-binding transcriptional MerR regulator
VPLSKSRDYLSIGEVLEVLRPDFPDISISKLRFLESEELVTPERTPSGYRKFFDRDVERLRYILTLQRDQFLPLKVIRQKLAGSGDAGLEGVGSAGTSVQTSPSGDGDTSEAAARKKERRTTVAATGGSDSDGLPVDLTGAQLSRAELMDASGLSEESLRGLEEFRLLGGDDGSFDETDLVAARAAKGLIDYGLEPRHLRMYRQFADREAAFFEQIISPLAHRRDPEARSEAYRSLQELLQLSRHMREAVLRSSLRGLPR